MAPSLHRKARSKSDRAVVVERRVTVVTVVVDATRARKSPLNRRHFSALILWSRGGLTTKKEK